MKPLFESFAETVSGDNVDELARSTIHWLDGQCGQPQLRQSAITTLKDLSLRLVGLHLDNGAIRNLGNFGAGGGGAKLI